MDGMLLIELWHIIMLHLVILFGAIHVQLTTILTIKERSSTFLMGTKIPNRKKEEDVIMQQIA